MTKTHQRWAAFIFGIAFVVTLIVLAVKFPTPTIFQYTVFRIVLSLAAAGVASMLSGFVELNLSPIIRAGGSLAVFLIVYFYNPAQIAVTTPPADSTSIFNIALACEKNNEISVEIVKFPFSDISGSAEAATFAKLVKSLPELPCDIQDSKIFRVKDEKVLGDDANLTAITDGNLSVIVLPSSVISKLGSEHAAFTQVNVGLQENPTNPGNFSFKLN